MTHRELGTSGVKVSPVIFGGWAIGGLMWGGSDERASLEAIRAGIDNGITTIDTAPIYGMGYSEELVGRAIEGRRDKVVLATKCGLRWDTDEGSHPWPTTDNNGKAVTVRKNSKPDSIVYECEQSLKRLKTDVIDIYQIHWPDKGTPVESSMRAMEKLKKQGKIRAIGVSNYDAALMKRAMSIVQLDSLQPPYSLIKRGIEKETLPFCRENNIGVICYSPLERGLLTGSVTAERTFAPGDHRMGDPFFTPENRARVSEALGRIRPIADDLKVSLAQLVIAWTIAEPGITAALAGARDARQAAHNAQALTISLSEDERAAIRGAFDRCAAEMN